MNRFVSLWFYNMYYCYTEVTESGKVKSPLCHFYLGEYDKNRRGEQEVIINQQTFTKGTLKGYASQGRKMVPENVSHERRNRNK